MCMVACHATQVALGPAAEQHIIPLAVVCVSLISQTNP